MGYANKRCVALNNITIQGDYLQSIFGLHEGRIVFVGLKLQQRDMLCLTYEELYDWASPLIAKVGGTLKYSLKQAGLYRPGKQGLPGGIQLLLMQNEIIDYANSKFERLLADLEGNEDEETHDG